MRYLFLLLTPLFLFSSIRFYGGPEVFYRDYHEDLSGDAKSDEYGFLYGFEVGLEVYKCNLYSHLFLTGGFGKTTYDGTVFCFLTRKFEPSVSHTDNKIWDVEANLGPTFFLYNKFQLIPLFGVGYHNWFRKGTEDSSDYDERYSWVYFPLGLQFEACISERVKGGLLAKALWTDQAQVKITRLFPEPITFSLANHIQYYANGYFGYIWSCADFRFVVFYINQGIGGSEPKAVEGLYWSIPSSCTNVFGVKLEFGYRF